MISSILTTISRLLSLQPDLAVPSNLWDELIKGLQLRGQNVRESGAFLLGRHKGGGRIVEQIIFYDTLDPSVSAYGYINFDGRNLGRLWEICRNHNQEVVADVHTHPGGAAQSTSDKQHPMISEAGHLAMIIPNFARTPVPLGRVGLYRYRGGFSWEPARGSLLSRPLVISGEQDHGLD